jgi:eukaryotic-like serine/threonine-protein kinase
MKKALRPIFQLTFVILFMLTACAKAAATATPMPTTIPAPTLGIGSTMIGKDNAILVYVPEGEFTMGSDGSFNSIADPEHQVNLDAFWIDQTEVTNAMYAKCVADGSCKEPLFPSSNTHMSYYNNSEFDNYPVLYVDWNRAKIYCSWAERRLPTEAEWEKAARGEDGRTYPWGEEDYSCDKANYDSRCVGDTSPVGSYESGKSPYGAYDMAGNVSEWVSSLYKPYPYEVNDGRENLSDPGLRVLRGSSWYFKDTKPPSSGRLMVGPSSTNHSYVGFRCASSP